MVKSSDSINALNHVMHQSFVSPAPLGDRGRGSGYRGHMGAKEPGLTSDESRRCRVDAGVLIILN